VPSHYLEICLQQLIFTPKLCKPLLGISLKSQMHSIEYTAFAKPLCWPCLLQPHSLDDSVSVLLQVTIELQVLCYDAAQRQLLGAEAVQSAGQVQDDDWVLPAVAANAHSSLRCSSYCTCLDRTKQALKRRTLQIEVDLQAAHSAHLSQNNDAACQ
jgi:hypothetical protein